MSNFFPVGKVGANKIYTEKSVCEIAEGQECFDITGVDLEANDLVEQVVPVLDLVGNPVLDDQGVPVTETKKVFVANPTKVALQQEKIAKAIQIQAYESGGAARRNFGQKLINITTGYTGGLNLSAQDSLALATSLNQIITLCTIGRIDLAKAAIEAYTPDQFFTQNFKDLLLWELDRNGY